MSKRPKHSKPYLEKVLRAAEKQNWSVTRGNKYFKMKQVLQDEVPVPEEAPQDRSPIPLEPQLPEEPDDAIEAGHLLEGGIMSYNVEMSFKVDTDEGHEDLESHLSEVLDALYDDPRIAEPDLVGSLVDGTGMFSFIVEEADDDLAAAEISIVALRCAVHTAHGSTPGWERHTKWIQDMRVNAELQPA